MDKVIPILKEILKMINTLPVKWRVFFTFLILILLAGVGITPAVLQSGNCQAEKLSSKKVLDSLILTQNHKDQVCQITIQKYIQTQEKMQDLYAGLLGIEKVVSSLQPDTVLIKPPQDSLQVRTMKKKCKNCPAEVVKPNKAKQILSKKIAEMKQTFKE